MKKILFSAVICVLLFVSCKTSKISSSSNDSDSLNNSNNVSIQNHNSINNSVNNSTKINFTGTENEVVFEYFNSFFNSKNKRDVIIIEGNGNIIHIVHNGTVDNSVESNDTLIIHGNESYLTLMQQYVIDNSKATDWDEFISTNKEISVFEFNDKGIISESSEIENKITNEILPFKTVYNYYLDQSNKGNWEATFYIGELYFVGLGVPLNIKKAINYYELAAKNGYADAQATLGYIFESDIEGLKKDIKLAKYWYNKAATNGSQFAIERLMEINTK